jgi:hypothetical protein
MEGALMAGGMVAAMHGTEHRSPDIKQVLAGVTQFSSAACRGVPDHELHIHLTDVDEDTAVTAIAHEKVSQLGVKSTRGAGPSGGDEVVNGEDLTMGMGGLVVDEAEHRSRLVELAVVVVESRIREEDAPGLGEYGEAEKARGLIRREAEEDLMDEFIRQIWRECRHRLQIWRQKRISLGRG